MRLEAYVAHHAATDPDWLALCCGDEQLTYRELYRQVTAEAEEIKKTPQRAIVFRASQTTDCIVRYLAIHVAGRVAVPLEKDTPEEYMEQICLQVEKAPIPNDAYDILFTTGTTGQSKGVIISHKATLANTENLIQAQHFSHDLDFLLVGPLNHIGTLSKIHPVLVQGGTLHILDGLKDMEAFFKTIDNAQHKVATFLVPTSIRLLLTLNPRRLTACKDKIDFIETGAAPMPQADMERLCTLLPHSRLYNTYASTETGIIATYDYNHNLCQAGCLGHAMQHSSIVISPEGHIICQGQTLMSGYLGDKKRTKEILHPMTDNMAIHTQDCGWLDENGWLHLTGRKGDVLNIGGYKIAPAEVEEAAMTVNGIKDCICIQAMHPTRGLAPKLLIVADDTCPPTVKEIVSVLKSKLERYKIPQLYEFVTKIARTYNGKLDRKAYQ